MDYIIYKMGKQVNESTVRQMTARTAALLQWAELYTNKRDSAQTYTTEDVNIRSDGY